MYSGIPSREHKENMGNDLKIERKKGIQAACKYLLKLIGKNKIEYEDVQELISEHIDVHYVTRVFND